MGSLSIVGFDQVLEALPMVAIAEIKGVLPQADPHFYEEKH